MSFIRQIMASALGTLIALVLFGALSLVMFFLVIGIASSGLFRGKAGVVPTVTRNTVMKVRVTGRLSERTVDDPFTELFSFTRHPISLSTLRKALAEAEENEHIKALWLQPEFVLAGWGTLVEARQLLQQFRARSGKPIIASAGTDGFGEKEYFLASVADEIYAPPQANFELNGFFLAVEFYHELLRKLNIEPQVVRAGRFKSAVEPFIRDSLSEENRLQLTELLTVVAEVFRDSVAVRRGLTPEQIDAWSDEIILTAREAATRGLIDSLWFADQVERRLKEITEQETDKKLRTVDARSYRMAPSSKGPASQEIAVIYAEGTIVSGESRNNPDPLFGGTMLGSDTFVRAVQQAADRERVKAIVIRVNSPGGSVTASDAMWHAVEQAAQKKPVVVSMGDVAASGGYYISTPAHKIVAEPTTITGSIGVFGLFFDVGDFFDDKLGIHFDVVKTDPYADMLAGIRSFTPVERQRLERFIEDTYQTFLQKVAMGRGMTVEAVDRIAQGRVWTGAKAVEIGLVDTLGGLQEAIQLAVREAKIEGAFRLWELPRRRTWVEQLFRNVPQVLARFWARTFLTDAERRIWQQLQHLKEMARWQGKAQMRMPYRVKVY